MARKSNKTAFDEVFRTVTTIVKDSYTSNLDDTIKAVRLSLEGLQEEIFEDIRADAAAGLDAAPKDLRALGVYWADLSEDWGDRKARRGIYGFYKGFGGEYAALSPGKDQLGPVQVAVGGGKSGITYSNGRFRDTRGRFASTPSRRPPDFSETTVRFKIFSKLDRGDDMINLFSGNLRGKIAANEYGRRKGRNHPARPFLLGYYQYYTEVVAPQQIKEVLGG